MTSPYLDVFIPNGPTPDDDSMLWLVAFAIAVLVLALLTR